MIMNAVVRCLAVCVLAAAVLSSAPSTRGDTVFVKTNFVERWVTNTIEMSIPVHRVVNEYHTNVHQRFTTNVVDFYATNVVRVVSTNNILLTVTHTNVLQAYQTNYRTLNLTNWSTVLVLKTNWVNQMMTNVVELDVPRPMAQTQPVQTAGNTKVVPVSDNAPTALDPVVLEAKRGSRAGGTANIPVEITARWSSGSARQLRVEQWRVEGERSAILCFGQEQEFRRALPPGRYKVELKARGAGTTLTIKGTLVVSSNDVSMERRLAQN